MIDFDWKRKERLQEQLKFFGAKKTRFISCYANKPRIKVELKPELERNGTNHLQAQALGALQANLSMATGLQNARMGALQGLASSQSQLAQAQALAMQQTAMQQAIHDFNRGASLVGLVGSAQASGILGVSL